MVALPSVLIVAHIALQIWQRKGREVQDWLLYVAYVFFLAQAVCYMVVIPTVYKINRVLASAAPIYEEIQPDGIFYTRMFFVTLMSFWISLWTVKLSLLFLYKKLMDRLPRIYKKLWIAVVIFCIISLIACIVSYFTSCDSIRETLVNGYCPGTPRTVRAQMASLYMSFAVDVLSDFMIMALPIQLVWNLQLPRGQKIAVIALFSSGFVCIVFATLRVSQIAVKAKQDDASPEPTWLSLWSIIETSVAVCIGCMPAFAIAYRRHVAQSQHTGEGYIRQGPSNAGTALSRPENSRFTKSRNETYWGDGASSQEELALPLKDIVITQTFHQEAGNRTPVTSTHIEANSKENPYTRNAGW
ncbi:hypothetical protein M011DRAFT_491697 [Sporormia fimetaria CBS 119925]|uniref:Rhodopsin domain-containing protein n=1 Tax=Sporormia fimetaria CBS 119925 TaxID=1340428 RepID=A0A6A6VMW6_9PLEO|nr:hypothetical protein M011DRAFT_491697 [Sporormia fimetaria CBS 119925]